MLKWEHLATSSWWRRFAKLRSVNAALQESKCFNNVLLCGIEFAIHNPNHLFLYSMSRAHLDSIDSRNHSGSLDFQQIQQRNYSNSDFLTARTRLHLAHLQSGSCWNFLMKSFRKFLILVNFRLKFSASFRMSALK